MYVQPEVEKAHTSFVSRQLSRNQDAKVGRIWSGPDVFGSKAQFRDISIFYSAKREKLTGALGTPGHPAPAFHRWLAKVEAKRAAQDWTNTSIESLQAAVDDAEDEEEEEEAIMKM